MELDLISCGLSAVSDIEEDLSGVAVLNLHGNYLCSLHGLAEISNLVELNVSSNAFTSCDLPELVNLPFLKVLDLSGNRITSLEDLPFLPSVVSLAVAFNGIRSLNGIANFPNLETIDSRGNAIASAQNLIHIQPLGKLQDLWLSNCDGRYSNPVCTKAGDIVHVFDQARYFGNINGKDRHQWSVAVALTMPFTPKFDEVARRFLSSAPAGGGGGDDSSSIETEEDDAAVQLKMRLFICVLSSARRRQMQRWFHAWCRVASFLSGQVSDRVQTLAITTQQMQGLKEIITEERCKYALLEGELAGLRKDVDNARNLNAADVATSKRYIESERERSEQLRVQLLKHVAISNTQNAELHRSRQQCVNLENNLKRIGEASDQSDTLIAKLRAELGQAVSDAQESNKVMIDVERSLKETVDRLREDLQSASEQVEQSRMRCKVLEQAIDQTQIESTAYKDQLNELQLQNENMRLQLINFKQTELMKDAEIENLRAVSEATLGQQQTAAAALRSAEAEVLRLKEELEESEVVSSQQKKSIDDLCAIVMDLKSTLKKNHARCRHVEEQRDEMKEQLKISSEQRKIQHGKQFDEMRLLKNQYNMAMESLQKQLEFAISERIALKADFSKILKKLRVLEASTGTDREVCDSAEKKVEELQHALRVKDKMLDDQLEMIAELRDRLGEEAEEARLKALDMESQFESMREEIHILQRQLRSNSKLEKELSQLVSDLRETRNYDSSDSEDNGFCRDISSERYSLGARDIVNIKLDISALHQALALKNKHLESAQLELQELASALAYLKDNASVAQQETKMIKNEHESALVAAELAVRTTGELKERICKLEETLQTCKSHYEHKIANLSVEKDELLVRLHGVNNELKISQETNKKFKDTLLALSNISQ